MPEISWVHAFATGSRPAAKYRDGAWPPSQSKSRPSRAESLQFAAGNVARVVIGPNYHQTLVPLYEFACQSCSCRFDELVGSHVGLDASDVVCPECGSAEVERLLSSSYAPLHRQPTPNQRRRLEDKRGIDRAGAQERFGRQRAAERSAARRRGSS
jgi:putative FmdB family regulatory protein